MAHMQVAEEPRSSFMVKTLVNHLVYDRLLPILPVQSSLATYTDVESDSFYQSCRSVLINVAVSQDLNQVVSQLLKLLQLVLKEETSHSPSMTDDTIHSALVLARLLSDTMECVWDTWENSKDDMTRQDDREKKLFSTSIVGFSTHRPGFHQIRPPPLQSEVVHRLLDVCTRLKYNINTLEILRIMSNQAHGHNARSIGRFWSTYKDFYQMTNIPYHMKKIDLTVTYIQKYVAASNPIEFMRYIKKNTISHLLASNGGIDSSLTIEYFDLFGCIFLTKRSFPIFLQTIRTFSNLLQKTIYNCLLLHYASKCIMFWIMARPKQYSEIMHDLETFLEPHQHDPTSTHMQESDKEKQPQKADTARAITEITNLLFEEIYSTFNVSSILNISNSHVPTGPTTVASLTKNSKGQTSSSPSPSHLSAIRASTPVTSPTAPSPTSPLTKNMGDFISDSPFSNSQVSFRSQKTTDVGSSSSSQQQTPSSHMPEPKTAVNLSTNSAISTGNNQEKSTLEVLHLRNILELYISYDEKETLTHSSVLKFLACLTMFDPESFKELNVMSFKYLSEPLELDNSSIPKKLNNKPKDREKTGSIRQITQELKKLTNISLHKSSKMRFLNQLLKIFNTSSQISDSQAMGVIRVFTMMYSIGSTVSLVNSHLPFVTFCKRLFIPLGAGLNIGENWNFTPAPLLKNIPTKFPGMYVQLSFEYFAASLQLKPKDFLVQLHLEEVGLKQNSTRQKLYVEGFRIFFHLPTTKELRRHTSEYMTGFFKELFSSVSDILLKDVPYFYDESIAEVTDAIVDGSILESFRSNQLFKISTLMSVRSYSPVDSFSSENSDRYSNNDDNSTITATATQDFEVVGQQNSIISPTARRVSGTLSSSSKGASSLSDKTQLVLTFSSSAVMAATPLTPTPQVTSPLRQISRVGSDEALLKVLKNPVNSQNEETDSTDAILLNDARCIMLNVFSIFKRMTSYILLSRDRTLDEDIVAEDFKTVIKPIFVAIIDIYSTLQETAQSFMGILINYLSDVDSVANPEKLKWYYLLCTYIVTLFATALFDLDLPSTRRQAILSIIVKFMKLRYDLGRNAIKNGEIERVRVIEQRAFVPMSGTVGRGLFVSLFSTKNAIQKLLILAYKEYHQAISLHKELITTSTIDQTMNLDFVKAMAESHYVTSGSVAFQRTLRSNILNHIRHPDPMLFDSIQVIFRKWLSLAHKSSLTQAELADFRSFAGLIASLSGILLTVVADGPINFDYLPKIRAEITKEMKYFVQKQCHWLNNSDLLTRENSRDILCAELHPLAFKLLFAGLNERLRELNGVNLADSTQEMPFILLEQMILIMATILGRDDEERVLFLFSLDIVKFIDRLIDIVRAIDHDSMRYFKAIIHLAKVFRTMEHSEDSLSLKGHYRLKNRWLKVVTNWFKIAISKECDYENLSKPHREMDLAKRDLDILYVDTAIECSKALTYLTKDMPLEVPPSNSAAEMARAKNVVFGNYFSTFLKGLEKTTDPSAIPVSLKHKTSILNDNVLISLTNISNANVDACMRYTLPMGFSSNIDIRLAFLRVFTNIVKNYSKGSSDKEQLQENATSELIDHLIRYPVLVSQATDTCPPNDKDEFITGLMTAFTIKNASHVLVSHLIQDEIVRSARYMDILRRNSCASRALSLFARSKGNGYLIHTLQPTLQELIDKDESFDIEKLKPGDPTTDAQVARCLKYIKKVIDAIMNSVDDFPSELFSVCQTIYKAAKEKFPEYAILSVGSFVFLRFICPALVSPESENIVNIKHGKDKNSFITLAKIIQNLANGSDNLAKWPSLEGHKEFLKDCSTSIFGFLAEVSNVERKIEISIGPTNPHKPWNINFFRRFLYEHDFAIRQGILNDVTSYKNIDFCRQTIEMVDNVMQVWGQPILEYRNDLPTFVKENMDKYPQLYDFMGRHAFRKKDSGSANNPFVHESMSYDGYPTITVTFRRFKASGIDLESIVYRLLQVYARIWTSKHYFVMDCTEFDDSDVDLVKLISLLLGMLPDIAFDNCAGYFYFNVTASFIGSAARLFEQDNPYIARKVPHHFANSTDTELKHILGLSPQTLEVQRDVRVSLRDVLLYNELDNNTIPVSLRIGNKYFQVLHSDSVRLQMPGYKDGISINCNEVYELSMVASVNVSFSTALANEFTVEFSQGKRLIFSSFKYLEIVKMFYYALAKIQDDYVSVDAGSPSNVFREIHTGIRQHRDNISNILLIVLIGLYNEEDAIKNASYNLLATTQEAFDLDFGINFHTTPEVYVPNDATTFLRQICKSIAETAPELTPYICKYTLNALENNLVPYEYIPHTVCCFSYWTPNLYQYVYISDEEEGPEYLSRVIRSLIKLTVKDVNFTTVYLQEIWFPLAVDDRLTSTIVEEVISHALERDSENKDWRRVISLLAGLPTVDVASNIVQRLMKIVRSFLPSLKLEVSTQSWSELYILVRISVPLFFEAPLLTQMYLPELLYIISLLIDVGPTTIRTSFHELLMNVCHSLTINDALPAANRQNLDDICGIFAQQKQKFIFGFSQDRGQILQNFSASSFSSKFNTLEHFTANIILTMENAYVSEVAHWKTRFKMHLMDSTFNSDSFLSARAMMILGFIGESGSTDVLCKNLLCETKKLIANPLVSDEHMFLIIAHCFTYSKLIEGLDPSGELMKQLFWLSTIFASSTHPLLFEGGLLFIASCLKRLHMSNFEKFGGVHLLSPVLIDVRKFAGPLLSEIEAYTETNWTEETFAQLILSFIIRGLGIPFAKASASSCLEQFFRNTYYEHRVHKESEQYLIYMLLLYIVIGSERLTKILNSVEFNGEFVELCENNKLPSTLIEWLCSDSFEPNATLFQAALFFSCPISDEPSRVRFCLLVKHLLQKNPPTVFRFYAVMRKALRKIVTLEHNSECVTTAFEIIGLLVKYDEFNYLEEYSARSFEIFKEKGIGGITQIRGYDPNYKSILMGIEEQPQIIYQRKRLCTMILARMTCYM